MSDPSRLLLPAMLVDRIILPGQRTEVRTPWDEHHSVLRALQGQECPQVIAVAGVDDLALEEVSVGTLVDIELFQSAGTDIGQVSLYGRGVARSLRIVRRRPSLLVEASIDSPEVAFDAETLRLATSVLRLSSASLAMRGADDEVWKELGPADLAFRLAATIGWHGASAFALLSAPDAKARLQMLRRSFRRSRKRLSGSHSRPRSTEETTTTSDLAGDVEMAKLPAEVRAAVEHERTRMSSWRNGDNAEAAARFLLDMVWEAPGQAPIDLAQARALLDAGHYGMDEVKESVLDFLSTREWLRQHGAPPSQGPGKILCLVGPPGVGKTSIGKEIAQALGRHFEHLSLGGADDIFLAGADQSYSQARPGEVARRLRAAGVHASQVVFLIDEIDKVATTGNHTPLPVLLALLDPIQNAKWQDRFIDAVRLDLSGSLFLCTANREEDIPAPLRDRLQLITLPGYTNAEKLVIAKTRILPRLFSDLVITDQVRVQEDAIAALIESPPPNPGLRELQRQLETIVTRGLRRHQETGVAVIVNQRRALEWIKASNGTSRSIGFQPRLP